MQTQIKNDISNKEHSTDKPRILLIEDESITIEVISFYLKDEFIVDVAATEQQALEFIKNKKYFAVLLDINLGRGGNGLNVLKELRKIPGLEKLPVIAETAFALKGDSDEFLSAGCSHYISKPFVKSDLIDLLRKIKEEVEN